MLQVGIVGLPNVGKSTLFNALLKRQQALAANYPFATIEPNIGIVDVPDSRLDSLYETVLREYGFVGESSHSGEPSKRVTPESVLTADSGLAPLVTGSAKAEGRMTRELPKKIPAVCKFVDIAGLAPGAHKGEGLGNKFLSHIREVDLILHIVRNFADENIIRAGSTEPQKDIELINTELILKDLETVEKVLETSRSRSKGSPAEAKRAEALEEIKAILNKGEILHASSMSDLSYEIAKELALLTAKPQIVVYNTDENVILACPESVLSFQRKLESIPTSDSGVVAALLPRMTAYVCAKMESELSALSEEEQKEYLKQAGVEESGLDKIIRLSYQTLGYSSFFTAGPKEVRAWQFLSGWLAPKCAGVIHTDFEKAFIAMDVVDHRDYLEQGSWKACKDKGLIRLEGRDYEVKDGEVVIFRVNTR